MMDAPGKDDTLDFCVVNVNALTATTTTGDLGRAVIDTAAAASVAGGKWTDDYLKQLRAAISSRRRTPRSSSGSATEQPSKPRGRLRLPP